MSRFDRVEKLSASWIEHCKAAGDQHVPMSEGGRAEYDTNLSGTYIECCVPRCKWAASLRGEDVIETPKTTIFASSRIAREYPEGKEPYIFGS